MSGAKKHLQLIFLITISLFSGCYNDFDPIVAGKYENIMVFSVLDNRSDIQFAYAQKTYQHLDERKNLSGLELWLSEVNGNTYKFRDTTTENENFKTYYISGVKPARGKTYQIYIAKDSSIKENAAVTMPYYPIANSRIYYQMLKTDDLYPFHGIVNFNSNFIYSTNNSYYKYELFVEFNKTNNGKIETIYRSIPDSAVFDQFGHTSDGAPSNRHTWDVPITMLNPFGGSEFTKTRKASHIIHPLSIIYALQLFEINERKDITLKRAFIIVYTADEFFYENYMKTGWDQKISNRFDTYTYSPDIFSHSDIIKGVFGAITADTVNIPIESQIIEMWGYKNGQ